MESFETRITGIIPRTHDVKSFRMEIKPGLSFQAGQFMALTMPVKGEEQTKYFSFSNSPTESGYIEFTKKITSSDFSQALNASQIGDTVTIKMPLGCFILDENQKIAFLSGGIGITPIRSMCKYIMDKNLAYDAVLLYGNRTISDIAFKSDLDQFMSRNSRLRVIYCLDTAPQPNINWQGRVGFIDAAMVKQEIPDFEQRKFYVCGPPLMVDNITAILKKELSIPPELITKETFAGY